MKKCVLITNDARAAQQIWSWLRLFEDAPYLETYSKLEKFETKYAEPMKSGDVLVDAGLDAPADVDPTDPEERRKQLELEAELSPIRLLIVDLDAISLKPLDWLVAERERLKNLGHLGDGTQFKTLLMGYDDPHVRPDRFRHEAVDDMVIKPLDQQFFMQKVELLLADKPDISPSFIFRAQAEFEIEIGKDAVIDEVSDFAVSIRNPTPIAEGVFAQIHSRVFGDSAATRRILGRCYASVRHPQYEGLWLVRFSLFGITTSQLNELRRFVRGRQMPGRLRTGTATSRVVVASPNKIKLPPRYRIAIIDLNRDVLAQSQTTIEENFDRTAVTTFPSYTRFLGGLAKLAGLTDSPEAQAEGTGDEDDETPEALVAGIPGGRITMVINEDGHGLLSFDPALRGEETFLGLSSKDWLARASDWMSTIPKDDHEDFNEFLNYTATGGQGVTGLRFVDGTGSFLYTEVKGRLHPAVSSEEPTTLQLEIKQVERSAWLELNRQIAKGATPDQYRFDAIVIDGGLIRTDASAWLEGLQGALVRAKVITEDDPLPKIIILADEESRVQPGIYARPGFADFIFKPVDRKQITDKLAVAAPQLSRSVMPETSPFVPCELNAAVCKTIVLEEISEFGVTVRHATPLRPKVFVRFFSNLFGDAGDGVLARCTASISSGGQNPTFKCQFVFFGCSDELHKRIRNWIREDYALKKEATL